MITQSDLVLFKEAQAALIQAQAVVQFVSAHIAKTYGITESDKVNLETGEITRGEEA